MLQLWEQLKSDADSAYSSASELLDHARHVEEAAKAAEAKLTEAKKEGSFVSDTPAYSGTWITCEHAWCRKADSADLKVQQGSTAAQQRIEAASDALSGSLTARQGSTPEGLDSLALSRLDRWRQAHPSVSGFQVILAIVPLKTQPVFLI